MARWRMRRPIYDRAATFQPRVNIHSTRKQDALRPRTTASARCEERAWDYGAVDQTYPCWIVAEHPETNTAFAYCAQGFGPTSPWGLLAISGPHTTMGMDSGWFSYLEDCVRSSPAWEGENPLGYQVR